jgi:hypothetical protein
VPREVVCLQSNLLLLWSLSCLKFIVISWRKKRREALYVRSMSRTLERRHACYWKLVSSYARCKILALLMRGYLGCSSLVSCLDQSVQLSLTLTDGPYTHRHAFVMSWLIHDNDIVSGCQVSSPALGRRGKREIHFLRTPTVNISPESSAPSSAVPSYTVTWRISVGLSGN